MHLDLKKDISSIFKLAFAGIVALLILNSVRFWTLIWVGYAGGGGSALGHP
jgi:hypothetical protein